MRILYVVSRPLQINTSASIRNRATISGLKENGHFVDVVTTMPDSNHMSFDDSMEMQDVNCKYIELHGVQSMARIGRRIRFLKPIYNFFNKCFQRNSIYDNLVGIVNHTSLVDLKESKYDVVISSSDPKSSHLFVDKLLRDSKEYFTGKWIQIWGDPFLDDITLSPCIDKNSVYKEELRLLESADKIIYVSKLTLIRQKERYGSCAYKMHYHPIPYNNEIISDIRDLSKVDSVKVAYCGDYHSKIRNIIPLYEAVKSISHINLTIYGMTDLILNQTENIIIKPRQKHSDVEALEKEADILVHLSNLKGSQIPGKLYQYSGTNKPILFILDGDIKLLLDEFRQYNRFNFSNNTTEDISRCLIDMIKYQQKHSPIPEFSKKIISNKILD